MRILTLSREIRRSPSTYGTLCGHGALFAVMEREWLGNVPNISCIPAGGYLVKRDTSGQHKFYRVMDVEGRTLIEIHPANHAHELKGCIALGSGFKYRDDKPYGLLDSRDACDALLRLMGDEDWILHIKNGAGLC